MKILIVDDKEENLYLLESLLKGCGYEVVSAVNGQDALEKLQNDSFSMIISDILMPVMDGYTLLKKVRSDDKLKDISFVFYTATYTDEKDEELALKLRVDKYIRKPIEPEEFINIIEGVIREAERGKKRPPKPALKEEKEVLKLYSERLVKKLEKKMLDLEKEVAERKRAEEELEAERLKLKEYFENLPILAYNVSLDGIIQDCNQIVLETLGYSSKKELIGKPLLTTVYTQSSQEKAKGLFLKWNETGKLKNEEMQVITKQGKVLDVLLNVETIYDATGQALYSISTQLDITARKLAEKEREKALELALNANMVKTLFLANMSHEIRTPLNSIMGFTELIESIMEQHIGEEEKSFFEIIRNSGERLMRTVHEILDISQIESGTFEAVRHPLNLNTIITQMQNEFQIRAKEKGLELSYRCGNANITIEGDEYCITQAISNLVDNSIKYTETGKVDLSLLRKNGDILLKIQDTGIGMSQEFQERMFSPFSQESEGYTKDYQGIGLGLALTKGYLDLNGVNIDVQSKKGSGTTITLTFRETKQDRKRSPKAKKQNKAKE